LIWFGLSLFISIISNVQKLDLGFVDQLELLTIDDPILQGVGLDLEIGEYDEDMVSFFDKDAVFFVDIMFEEQYFQHMNLLDLIIKVLSAHNLVLFEINFHHLT
jgi:hypothetical protein